jgi:2-dehydro-3-deoxyphosphogluconate aldolase/(4S)-4-hydroxy-2-oxoglutarate aldolase
MINPAVKSTLDEVLADGVFLCVRLGAEDDVLEACLAAARGGLRVLEVTLTTPGALDVIARLSREPDLVVGGGTVMSPEDVRAVRRAGGRFVMSPVFNPRVVDEASLSHLLAIPGAATANEIVAAHSHGASLVKVFPARALGGPEYLRALRGPLPGVPMVPTSGPTAETIPDYLAAGAVAVGVGAEVFPAGYTLQSVEMAAHRVRSAMDVARREHESARG